MLETMSLLPMAPGTRSRRADGVRRPMPLLPKPKSPLGRQRLISPHPQHPQNPQSPLQSLPSQHVQQHAHLSTASPGRSIQDILNHANSMRVKRKLDTAVTSGDSSTPSDCDFDAAQRKRPRFAVEIVTKPVLIAPTAGAALGLFTLPEMAAPPALSPLSPPPTALSLPVSPPQKTASGAAISPATAPSSAYTAPTATSTATHSSSALRSKHQHSDAILPPRHAGHPSARKTSQLAVKSRETAVKGCKQELKSPHVTAESAVVAAAGPPQGGRKLRSQQATRFKSDLAAYFPEYDEVIGNEPREEHIFNIDTPILLSDAPHAGDVPMPSGSGVVHGYSDALFFDLVDAHVVDFGFLNNQLKGRATVDPLADALYEPHHKRAERLERSIRNAEKGRAQHEKDQIIRLLDGLLGHDWLRIMGVSGITETKKKAFEPARTYFVQGCRSILDKFRLWTLEEKRLKMEKSRAHAEELRTQEAAEGAGPAQSKGRGKGGRKAVRTVAERPDGRRRRERVSTDATTTARGEADKAKERVDAADSAGTHKESEELDNNGDDEQFDSSDADAVIAKQLRAEALARSRMVNPARKRRKMQSSLSSGGQDDQDVAPLPPKEVASFFQKRYQREAALSRSRRKGRKVMAWGQPVPEPAEADFELPGEIMTNLREAKDE